MRALCLLGVSVVMAAGSVWLFYVVSQCSTQIGFTLDGAWYDASALTLVALLIQLMVWSYVTMLALVMCVGSGTGARLRERTEETMGRAADTIKDMILDFGVECQADQALDKPEYGTEPLPRLSPAEFVAGMHGKVEQTLGRVAELINQAHTGAEVAGSEEYVKSLLGELRFDAIALALQMRSDADRRESHPTTIPLPLSTKSGKAKSYAASEHWRPVWVERLRNMHATETAFRLAARARRQSDN
jgi:hypothetical protein